MHQCRHVGDRHPRIEPCLNIIRNALLLPGRKAGLAPGTWRCFAVAIQSDQIAGRGPRRAPLHKRLRCIRRGDLRFELKRGRPHVRVEKEELRLQVDGIESQLGIEERPVGIDVK